MDKQQLEYWVENKDEFRKEIKKCKNSKELYNFLMDISSIKGYKLFAENKWDVPFESVIICNNGRIHLQFYLQGGRTYKTINGMSKKIELCRCSSYDNFSVLICDNKSRH